jgi:hypothetical protein
LDSYALGQHCDGLDFLSTHSAEWNMTPLALQAFFLRVAPYCHLIRSAPNYNAPVLALLVLSGAFSALRLMVAALALFVAQS